MALGALRDPDLADEVAQESLTRVVTAIREGRLRDPLSLGAFARAIARHVIVDTLRTRQRVVTLTPQHEAASEEDALGCLVTAEQTALLASGLQRLSEPDRELLRLSFFEGLTPQELAARLGDPGPRIRKRKERALQRLRALLSHPTGHESTQSPTLLAEKQSMLTRSGRPE